ncbi:MAG: HesA/MoeB/ThiF family protein [Treponema sp.]|nr:HesA/MoeB/ThiF family protein [Treponema sp.]
MNDRYCRQVIIPQIGAEGQEKLSRSGVFVIGAGGLGSSALFYLASAGVGRIGFADSDSVCLSNLNRQILHNIRDIGRYKTDSGREKLVNLNDEIEIISFNERITDLNIKNIINGYDIVLGAVDSFETRFIINRACISLNIPYIDGGINGFSGCVMFSSPPQTPCFSCVFPLSAKKHPARTSKEKEATGALGATAGVIGTFQANIALLRLLGRPNPAANKLLIYDGLQMSVDHVDIKRNDKCPACGHY